MKALKAAFTAVGYMLMFFLVVKMLHAVTDSTVANVLPTSEVYIYGR